MLRESRVIASGIDGNGAYVECAQLCDDCPRRTGVIKERAKGWKGLLLRRTEEKEVHGSPLRDGVIKSYQTNGRNGTFLGEGAENTGAVSGLNEHTVQSRIEAVVACTGPEKGGNVCTALGARSLGAIIDLDRSTEGCLDRQPVEAIWQSLATDSARIQPDIHIQEVNVFINGSKPGGRL